MCRNNDGTITIPFAGDVMPAPTDRVTLELVHAIAFHSDDVLLPWLIVYAYKDLNGLWLRFRKHMYEGSHTEEWTEEQYKRAMNYLVACAVHNDMLDAMVDLVERMAQEAW